MNQETPIEVLRPRMLYEALADAIRDLIFRHELAPGEAIDEFRLAKAFGVSRTPLREALKVLASEGLVELRTRQGCFVARLAWSDVVQLFDILEAMESFAVREAVKKRAPIGADGQFDRDLAAASGNRFLPDLLVRLVAKLRLAFGPLFDRPEMQTRPDFRRVLARAIAAGLEDDALRLLELRRCARRRTAETLFGRLGEAAPAWTGRRPQSRAALPLAGVEEAFPVSGV